MEHKPQHKHKVKLTEVPLEFEETFKRIACPSCSNTVPADNININDKIAKCNSCDVVFPFEKEISQLLPQQRIKQEVLRPEGIDIFRYRDELDISIQQPLTVLEGIWFGLSPLFAFLATILFTTGVGNLLWLIFGWTLAILPYLSLFNRSKQRIHVTIDDKYLFLEWRPKKFKKDRKYNINEIDQIYTKSFNGHALYMIVNGLEGQKHVRLLSGIASLSKARYLEQEIEKHLGITDKQVPEES